MAFYMGAIVLVPVASFLAATLLPADPRSQVRLAAGALQLLGVAVVGWGFTANRLRYGGRPPLLESFVTPVKRGLGLASPTRDEVEDVNGSPTIETGEPKVTVRAGPESSLERRVEILEERVEKLDAVMETSAEAARVERDELREGLRAETAVRRKAIKRMQTRVADAATEGMGREVVGLIWLATGIVAEVLVAVF